MGFPLGMRTARVMAAIAVSVLFRTQVNWMMRARSSRWRKRGSFGMTVPLLAVSVVGVHRSFVGIRSWATESGASG
jgi:hypothetical protein